MEETGEDRVARALVEENTGLSLSRVRTIKLRALDAEIEWATTETPHCNKSLLCRLQPGHRWTCRVVGPTEE